jgi:hypothetical protein
MQYQKEDQRREFVAVNSTIYSFPLILYTLDGKPEHFEYYEHICSELRTIPGRNKKLRIVNSIYAAIGLWCSWNIHLKKSNYPFNWYSCVQIENCWLKNGKGMPPLVLLNSKHPQEIKSIIDKKKKVAKKDFPLSIDFIRYYGSCRIALKKDDDLPGSCMWYICDKNL